MAGVVLAVVLAGLALVLRHGDGQGSTGRSGEMPHSEAIEQRWGVRVTQIGVSADGGLLDFRYLVLNSEKALSMLENVQNQPQLISEASGDVLTARIQMTKLHDLRVGETYFVLFYNAQGQVKPGTQVSVKIGDLQLDHVVVK